MLAKLKDAAQMQLPLTPPLSDIACLLLGMRASFYELSERLKVLEIEQTLLSNKFDALLALVADMSVQRR